MVDPAVTRCLVIYLRCGGADPQLSPWLEGHNYSDPINYWVQVAFGADLATNRSGDGLANVAAARPPMEVRVVSYSTMHFYS
ncbi:hypothetical protein G6L63_22465 [Agrobacterium vitis]|uniref:Uncharacterized protein n=1 Tax=Agrobacterium vitis TaxID=373 RepID=A0A7J4X0I8_AGRVI|nr:MULTISPECIES: hypothetical protein [Agrobacterium]KAA3522367.1 hypothetical protein DXT89_21335 [Agrobacterium vitis]MCF1479553.1 hypothetical protein [Agrobacterium vitis]MCM2435972.1 hypothetical protein [Agrobacterium rosae]MUZ98282.1 hypothetical protein [Agrobacterium vitis]NSZ50686.1 hypothetical protein [Agrobacterium vitis]